MLQSLTAKLDSAFKLLRGSRITAKDVEEAMRSVRMALLEADVNFRVAKDFCDRVSALAIGEDVLKSLSPSQQIIKIVHTELVKTIGGEESLDSLEINHKPKSNLNLIGDPSVILLAGLQGSGKTTTASKLALYARRELKKNPLLVSVDIYRPAAMEQLQILGKSVGVTVFPTTPKDDPKEIVKAALLFAKKHLHDLLIVDTAGRLQIDESLMSELQEIVSILAPHEILLVADSMTGQEAVNVALGFKDKVPLTGLVLTKLDGDTRGGAALSMKAVTEKPIKFIGVSEKPDGLEQFHPERLAGRILGMGDVLSLIEKAEAAFSLEESKKLEAKLKKKAFTLQDFLDQMRTIKKMGSLGSIAAMIPGVGQMLTEEKTADAERVMDRSEAMILSMTKSERNDVTILNSSRRKRIAAGSGTSVQELNTFIKQFLEMKKMMESLSKGGLSGLMKMMERPQGGGVTPPSNKLRVRR